MGTASGANDEGTTLIYDSGIVTGGAQIQTPIMDVRRFQQLMVVVNNAHSSARSVNFSWFLPGSTVSFAAGSWTIASSGDVWQFLNWGGGYSVSTSQAAPPPGFISLTMVAGGVTTARMIVWGR